MFFWPAWALSAPLVTQWQLPSGARVAWVEAPAIPMVDVRVAFDAGSRRDPVGQAGLAAATAHIAQMGLAATAGQPALDENQLTERWMDLGAQWSMAAGADTLSVNLRTLTDADVLPAAIELAARQLAAPRFEDTHALPIWQRERERMAAAWSNARTQPGTVVARRFAAAVYGDHPYGAEATPDTLARIAPADMEGFWQRHVRACRAHVTVVGAVSRAQVTDMATQLLSGLPQGGCDDLPPVPEVPPLSAAVEQRVPLATAQAHVWLGQPGYSRRDPDFFPLLLGNYILGGGGFVSRLTNEVREQRGLAYSVGSHFSPGAHAGAFTVSLQTRPDQADRALALARDVVARFVAEGPTEAELQSAKAFMVNGFVLRIDSNRKLLDNAANILWWQLPPDYLQTWTARIEAVSVKDIRRAFQRVLQPERMVAVVVGGAG